MRERKLGNYLRIWLVSSGGNRLSLCMLPCWSAHCAMASESSTAPARELLYVHIILMTAVCPHDHASQIAQLSTTACATLLTQ